MTGKEVRTLLEKNGWVLWKIKSSHHHLIKVGTDIVIVVPIHGTKELRPGTLNTILKAAGLK
jgi:predicted RNA binding protein YcfA (HicA-like mRNA interferase family)